MSKEDRIAHFVSMCLSFSSTCVTIILQVCDSDIRNTGLHTWLQTEEKIKNRERKQKSWYKEREMRMERCYLGSEIDWDRKRL